MCVTSATTLAPPARREFLHAPSRIATLLSRARPTLGTLRTSPELLEPAAVERSPTMHSVGLPEALRGHRRDVRGERLDLGDELRGRLSLAVGENLPSDILRHDRLRLEVHEDGAHGGSLGAFEFLVGDSAARDGAISAPSRRPCRRVRPVADARHAQHADVVEHRVERGAVLRPRVLVEHPCTGASTCPPVPRAERAAAAHEGVEDSHSGDALWSFHPPDRNRATLVTGESARAVIAADVRGGTRDNPRAAGSCARSGSAAWTSASWEHPDAAMTTRGAT